ncbi:hypothetical protein [Marinobacter sp. V034]|uniref:hypothetical protein n=1 Tax=Marinobacter sp. V034 TaxID=3459610 RepID=UPI0040441CFC
MSCNGNLCPSGGTFNNDIGECITDEKPTCASTVGDPIDVRNGNNYQTEDDASGGGLNLQRHYLYTVGPNPEALGQGQWLFPYTQSIETRTTTNGDNPQTSYAVNWTGGVRYLFKGNENIGYAFTSWQQPPFESVEVTVNASGEPSGWRLLAKSGVEYTFDSNGQLTEIDERHGKVFAIETTIDSEGNPIQRQINNLASQASLTYSYNTVNQTIETAVLARNGTSLTFDYTYNTDGMLSQITYPDGSARTYLYEDARYPQALTGISDNGNTLASWEYDAQGRTHRNTLGDGKDETSLQFNNDGTTTVTNALGKESIFSFTSVNGSTLVAKVDGQASQNCAAANQSFTYTASGRIETATDWSGHITRYEYNDRGQVTLKTLAEGTVEQQRISTIWHPTLDEPIRIKKGDRVQEFCYDPEGNVTRQATRKTSEPELACTQ